MWKLSAYMQWDTILKHFVPGKIPFDQKFCQQSISVINKISAKALPNFLSTKLFERDDRTAVSTLSHYPE